MCDMLAHPAQITSVSLEDRSGGAFDDIVGRFTSGRVIYIQVTSSVRGNRAIDWDYLSASKAQGKSRLQRWYDTYAEKTLAGERFTLSFGHPEASTLTIPSSEACATSNTKKRNRGDALSGSAESRRPERDRWATTWALMWRNWRPS